MNGVLAQNLQSYNIENQSILILCPTWHPCKAPPLMLRKFRVKKGWDYTHISTVLHFYSVRQNTCTCLPINSQHYNKTTFHTFLSECIDTNISDIIYHQAASLPRVHCHDMIDTLHCIYTNDSSVFQIKCGIE